jgi:hypothetical protein
MGVSYDRGSMPGEYGRDYERGYAHTDYGRGAISSGMGGTYEGEFGPEPGTPAHNATTIDWGHSENWLIPGPMTGRGPEGYQRSDERIMEDVCERLTQHGQLDASRIRVEVRDCEVTLEGTVDSRGAKRMAEDAVESVSGVRDVQNNLRIRQGESQSSTGEMRRESPPRGEASMTQQAENPKGSKRPKGSASEQNDEQTTLGSRTTQTQKSGDSQTGGVTGKSQTGGRNQQSGSGGTMKNG